MLIMLLAGCYGGLVYEERIVGNYYLIGIDAKDEMFLSHRDSLTNYDNSITNIGIRAVWHNDRYIIVRKYQCFKDTAGFRALNPDSIEFYIVDMESKDKSTYLGPFSEQKCMEEKNKLNITEEIVFEELFPEEKNKVQ